MKKAADAVIDVARRGFSAAMNARNARPKPPKPPKDPKPEAEAPPIGDAKAPKSPPSA